MSRVDFHQHVFVEGPGPRGAYVCQHCQRTYAVLNQSRRRCPGIHWYTYGMAPEHLLTQQQLKAQGLQLAPGQQRAGIVVSPHHLVISLYDRGLAIPRVIAPGVLQREATIRERYGCRFCTHRYLKQEAALFQNRVCWKCQEAIRQWNRLLVWAKDLVERHVQIITIQTDPEQRPHFYAWRYTLEAYATYDLVTGELVTAQTRQDDPQLSTIRFMLEALRPSCESPLYVFPTETDQYVFWRWLGQQVGPTIHDPEQWKEKRLMDSFSYRFRFPLFPVRAEKGWGWFPDLSSLTHQEYYEQVCTLLGIIYEPGQPIHALFRQVLLSLATQPEIVL